MESIGQKSTFSEHGHVAYQIKWNHEMQQHGSKYFARKPHLPPPPHDPRGQGQKVEIKLFQNMVMLHIKLIAITKSRRPPHAPSPTLGMGSISQNLTFSEHGHVA